MRLTKSLLGTSAVVSSAMLLTAQQAGAQSASAQAMLEEVVVTARRREENLQDLPLSIAAISADAMQAQGIYSIEDVSDFVPNVTLTTSDRANNTRIVIRGIGGGHPDPVFVFGSGMYIDGHYVPNSLGGYMSTMDIERVELLRGPQGTLFGKNVTGGAVNIISAKPGPDFDSSLTLRAAEQGDNDFRGMVNFPISENTFARLGFAKEVFDGYYYNRHLGVDTGGEDMSSINGAIRFQPGNWTIDVNAFMIKRRDDNKGNQCSELGEGPPGTTDRSAPGWGGFPGRVDRLFPGADQAYHDACNGDSALGTFINSSNKLTFSDIDQQSLFASAQWDSDGPVGGLESLTVKMSGSARYNDYDYMQDRDASFLDIDAVGTYPGLADIGQDNWTRGAEFLVEAQVNDRLEFTAGVNYFYEKAKNGDGRCREQFKASGGAEIDTDDTTGISPENPGIEFECDSVSGLFFELLPDPLASGGSPRFINQSRIENESLGIFGHLTYQINDMWSLDAGARWTEDDRNFWNMEGLDSVCNSGISAPGVQTLGDPSTTGNTSMCDLSLTVNFDNTVGGGFFNESSAKFDEITPMISLSRQLAGGGVLDDGMIYALYSEGFLTGGFNTELNSNVPTIAQFLTYDPESVTNYEFGFKGTLADGRVRIMADIFFMDYSNKQESINIANPDGAFGIDDTLGVVTNVSSVDISGVELELRASPWDGGFVSVDFGYLSNEYAEFSYPDPEGTGPPIDQSNTAVSDLTPDWTLNLGIEHEFQLGNGATLTPRLNIYSADEYDFNAEAQDAPLSPCGQKAYTKLGARMTYVPAEGNWQASIFGQNITDEKILEACGTSRGVYRYRHERPAFWGVEFQARWGAGA